jgi:hypothetical protein
MELGMSFFQQTGISTKSWSLSCSFRHDTFLKNQFVQALLC